MQYEMDKEQENKRTKPKPQHTLSLSSSVAEVDAFLKQARKNRKQTDSAMPNLRQDESSFRYFETNARQKYNTAEAFHQTKQTYLKNENICEDRATVAKPKLRLETKERERSSKAVGSSKNRQPVTSDISLQAMENDLKDNMDRELFEDQRCSTGARPKIRLEGQKPKKHLKPRHSDSCAKSHKQPIDIYSTQINEHEDLFPITFSGQYRSPMSLTPNETLSLGASNLNMFEQGNSAQRPQQANRNSSSCCLEEIINQRRILNQQKPRKDQCVQTDPNLDRCPFCLGHIVLESLAFRRRQVALARDRRDIEVVNGRGPGYALYNVPAPISATVEHHFTRDIAVEAPDRTYYGSHQLTYFRAGNFVYRGWSYHTLDGRIEHVPRFPIGIPLNLLRVEKPIRSPGSI